MCIWWWHLRKNHKWSCVCPLRPEKRQIIWRIKKGETSLLLTWYCKQESKKRQKWTKRERLGKTLLKLSQSIIWSMVIFCEIMQKFMSVCKRKEKYQIYWVYNYFKRTWLICICTFAFFKILLPCPVSKWSMIILSQHFFFAFSL